MTSKAHAGLVGRLLVATPELADTNFALAVVLVLEHAPEGALGVVLNRSRGISVDALMPEWHDRASPPGTLFNGGPVQPDEAVIALGAATDPAQPVLEGIGVVNLEHPPEQQPEITAVRLFTGYAGWGPQQLEDELAEGSWFVVEATPQDALTRRPERLWRDVLLRQGGMFATATPDPSQN